MNGAVGNGRRALIHEIAAAAIGVVLAAGVVYMAATGRDSPGELTSALGVVLGYFFGVSQGRSGSGGQG